jgi:uncharacterized protein (DUF1697 family)
LSPRERFNACPPINRFRFKESLWNRFDSELTPGTDSAAALIFEEPAMPTYIALLRGINVSGHKLIKMAALRRSLTALGLTKVQTYLQSGNVVFKTASDSADALSGKIEQKILHDFGFTVPVLLRTAQELAKVIVRNPFLKDPAVDQSKLHVTFLSDIPPRKALAELSPLLATSEQLQMGGREIYLHCPNGYGNTKVSNVAIEKKLALRATTRNWNTTKALLTLAE